MFTCFLSIAVLLYVLVLLTTTLNHVDRHSRVFVIRQTELEDVDPADSSITSHELMLKNNFTNQTIYLTQTEKCLPEYLKSPELIGDTTTCQCDVLVLSYKEECTATPLPHMTYIFHPSTTWSVGRNLLYQTAKARNKFYLYYIFIDDDVNLIIQPEKKSNSNPWRMFEESLRIIQPPIAIVDDRLTYLDTSQPKDCEPEHVTKFAQVFWFDAMFNAFHCQSVGHILPYPTRFDNISWWYSQMYVVVRGSVKFHRQVVGDTRLRVHNDKHRPYKRGLNLDTFRIVAEDVRKEIPEKYLNRSEPILQKWMKNVTVENCRLVSGEFYCSRAHKRNTSLSYIPFDSV